MTDPIDLGPLPRPFVPGDEHNPRDFYTADQLRAERQRTYALGRAAAQGEPVAWLRAIDEALLDHHVGVAEASDDYETAKRKLNVLLCHAQSIGEYFAKQDAKDDVRRIIRSELERLELIDKHDPR